MNTPEIITAEQAGISKENISNNALKVISNLQEAGYKAYLVGGCVRDLLLNLKPKDFDVSTNATPEQIKQTIKGSRIIGRRFRLVHVRFGYEVIEVATFRANANDRDSVGKNEMSEGDHGQLLRDNVYGSIEEDVVRRDFKVNALYFDPVADEVLDFMDSIEEIKNKRLTSIGDPKERFKEDPVRMLRVIRFEAKLGFAMEPEALEMIEQEGSLLSNVSSARLFDEVLKLFHGGAAYETFLLLRKYGIFKYLFPFTDQCIVEGEQGMPERALKNTDARIKAGKPVIPAFLFACMMWDAVRADAQTLMTDGTPESQAWRIAMNDGLRDQNQYVAVPRRLAEIILDIWNIHFRLIKRNPRMVKASLNNRRFRAAYDFLLLRASLHEVDQEVADWWTKIQEVDDTEKAEMVDELSKTYKGQRQNQGRHQDGERNGNSVNYNSAEYNYNQAPSVGNRGNGQSRQQRGQPSRSSTGSRRSNSNRGRQASANGRRSGGGYSQGNGNANGNPGRRRGNAGNGYSRGNPQGGYNGGANRGGAYSRPKDDMGHFQTADNTNEKKVKIRRKRKIAGDRNSETDNNPHF